MSDTRHPPTNQADQAESLLRLFLKDREQRANRPAYTGAACFLCGRPYSPQPPAGDDSTRFCGLRCREACGAGAMPTRDIDPFAVDQWRTIAGPPPGHMSKPMRMGRVGFFVDCLHCKREFESKGLRCCSIECERALKGRAETVADLAEVGDALAEKRQCETCAAPMPRYVGTGRHRRLASKTRRYCSERCSAKARRIGVSEGLPADKVGSGPVPYQEPIFGPSTPPLNLVGGYLWPDAPAIEIATAAGRGKAR